MTDTTIDTLSPGELATVVELQQIELKRLLGEHKQLNERIDRLLRLHEREQVLRQQMQAALEKLSEQRAIAGPAVAGTALPAPQIEQRLHRTEAKFAALQNAVGMLVDLIERKQQDDRPVPTFAADAPIA